MLASFHKECSGSPPQPGTFTLGQALQTYSHDDSGSCSYNHKAAKMRSALSNYFRKRRDVLLRELIVNCRREGEMLRILDVGGQVAYWRRFGLDFLKSQNVHITIINIVETELGPTDDAPDMFMASVGDGRSLDFPDNAFDLCHANSVIEHVGVWRDMTAFAKEIQRLAPSFYCQTPNYWFPIEPHFPMIPFNHWLPNPVRARLMQILPVAHAGRAKDLAMASDFVDSARLISRSQLCALFPATLVHAERLLLLAKSYTAVRMALPETST